jgi:hypothetical protein
MLNDSEITIQAKNLQKTADYRKVKTSLINQLDTLGLKTEFNADRIGVYMTLWISRKILQMDVESCLISTCVDSKENREQANTSLLIAKLDDQMGKILKDLGITSKTVAVDVEDEL